MSDSVGASSLYLSSDSVIDPYCEPCQKDGLMTEPEGYCPKCVEYYCQGCLRSHRGSAITRNHKILAGSDMPKSMADKPVKYNLCDKHDGENQDRYCFDHGSIVCGICCEREHKKCSVQHITVACKKFDTSAEEISFCQSVDLLLKYAQSVKESIENNIKRLEIKGNNIQKEAEVQRDKIIKKIRESYQYFVTQVTDKIKTQKALLLDLHSAADQVASDLNPTVQSLQRSKSHKEKEEKRFMDLKIYAEKVRLCEDKLKSLDMSSVDINYSFNMNIQPLMESNNTLGEVSLQTSALQCDTELPKIQYPYQQPVKLTRMDKIKLKLTGISKIKVKLTRLDKIDVKLDDDTKRCDIFGLDITGDGDILLSDYFNGKMKLFTPAGQLLSSLKLPEKPHRVTVLNNTEAAVTMQDKQIGIITIDDSSQLAVKRIINTENFVLALAAYKNNLVVTCDDDVSTNKWRSVQMIDMGGKIIWTVTKDRQGKDLFDFAAFLAVRPGDNGDTVIVTDENKHTITLLAAESGSVLKVCDVGGEIPLGVAVDNRGNVFVSYESGKISVWSGDMEEERCLVSRTDHLYYPHAMACDKRGCELFVSDAISNPDKSRYIHRFSISRK